MASQDRSAMLQKLRDRLTKKKGGFRRDPSEWKPPQVGPNEEFKAKAYILPPVEKGDACSGGTAEMGMDGLFFFQAGDHWVDRKKFPCPRVYDNDDCPYCQLGFVLLNETEDKKSRSEISKAYLPRTQYVCNLYFPDIKTNPEEVRGKVVYYPMPKTIFDKLEECIQADNEGDDPDDPQPWGIFYDPNDAYPLTIIVNRKGEYNSYVDSKLLAGGRGAIAKTPEGVEKILAMRHDIPSKFPERSVENRQTLGDMVNSLVNGTPSTSTPSASASAPASSTSGGFDADETETSKPSAKVDSETSETPSSSVTMGTAETVEDATKVNVDDEELNKLLNTLKNG